MNRKLLRGLVLEAGGRGDRIPQWLRYLVEPIALAGNICHVLRLLFVDHSVLSSACHRPGIIVNCSPSARVDPPPSGTSRLAAQLQLRSEERRVGEEC